MPTNLGWVAFKGRMKKKLMPQVMNLQQLQVLVDDIEAEAIGASPDIQRHMPRICQRPLLK